jgi:hypothetical protein
MKYRMLVTLPLAVLLAACASAGGRAAGGAYTQEIGPAVIPAVEREAVPILERFGYSILRTERSADRITIETHWVNRRPLAEEAEAGVTQARTRILISTRPRGTTNSAGSNLSGVTLRYEVEHMRTGGSDWAPGVVEAAETVAQVRRLSEAFRLELQVKGMQS